MNYQLLNSQAPQGLKLLSYVSLDRDQDLVQLHRQP